MTVKELRKALEGVSDDIDVEIFLPENVKPGAPDYMRHVETAKLHPKSSISDESFDIVAGGYFGY